MNCFDFLILMKKNGAMLAPKASFQTISLTNTNLQNIRAAILPQFMIELYQQCGGLNIGNGYIFGPSEIKRGRKYPIPSIVQLNTDLAGISQLRGKTVFGRNDLFWFAFDSFGKCFMLDNTTLKELRKYEEPYRALTDCLMAGNI